MIWKETGEPIHSVGSKNSRTWTTFVLHNKRLAENTWQKVMQKLESSFVRLEKIKILGAKKGEKWYKTTRKTSLKEVSRVELLLNDNNTCWPQIGWSGAQSLWESSRSKSLKRPHPSRPRPPTARKAHLLQRLTRKVGIPPTMSNRSAMTSRPSG